MKLTYLFVFLLMAVSSCSEKTDKDLDLSTPVNAIESTDVTPGIFSLIAVGKSNLTISSNTII